MLKNHRNLFSLATPVVTAESGPCIMCLKCSEVCPTNALNYNTARQLKEEGKLRIGMVKVKSPERCNLCKLCEHTCPFYADDGKQVIRISGLLKKDQKALSIVERFCKGCGHCVYICPENVLCLVAEK